MPHFSIGSDKLVLSSLATLFILALIINGLTSSAELISLTSALPKLQAIHEDTKSLLIKNVELKNKILAGLQQQNEAKIKQVKEIKPLDSSMTTTTTTTTTQTPQSSLTTTQSTTTSVKPALVDQFNNKSKQNNDTKTIDYVELEEFNRWVETNLEYAVKNTHASAEALKEEAQQNNGNVDYSEQAIKDGIEGVKYWQSAVIFQDKTLKNETYEPPE